MRIEPLAIFEQEADPALRGGMTLEEEHARLKPPTTIVVRIGSMRMVAEYPYSGTERPGCGSKLVARTHRGTELVEMLTTTCGNSGCGKSVSRQEMLEYIQNSGGAEFPFHTDGEVLRVASMEDISRWNEVRSEAKCGLAAVQGMADALGLVMKVIEIEPVLGGELVTVHYAAEERVDFRSLLTDLARHFSARIDMHQIGARDEARLTADYERCGQHCCCKNFLKVLKPVSMKSAKVQKATLDPLKISGRCGRLMCCLRYEDETYEELARRLPKQRARVHTSDGDGTVIETRTLVQLALVRLDDGREFAYPVEEIEVLPAAPGGASLGGADSESGGR